MKVSTSLEQVNNNLTESQKLRQEKEKLKQLEKEYQQTLKKELTDQIIVFFDTCDNLASVKINVINNKYEIIENATNNIYNLKVKKEVLNKTNDHKINDIVFVNKFNKSYIDISDDLSDLFYKILNNLLKDEEEKQKAEKQELTYLLFNYLSYLIKKEGLNDFDLSFKALQHEKIKKTVANDLQVNYNQDFIKIYNKTLKEIKTNYQTEAESLKAKDQTKEKKLSIWWKLAAITSLLNKKH